MYISHTSSINFIKWANKINLKICCNKKNRQMKKNSLILFFFTKIDVRWFSTWQIFTFEFNKLMKFWWIGKRHFWTILIQRAAASKIWKTIFHFVFLRFEYLFYYSWDRVNVVALYESSNSSNFDMRNQFEDFYVWMKWNEIQFAFAISLFNIEW